MSAARRVRGYTLIEVLLALGLTALLLGLLSAGMFAAASDWRRHGESLSASLDETLSALTVDRALHGAFAHSYSEPDTLARRLYFAGEDDALDWVSTVSPQRAPGLTAWSLRSVRGEGVYLALAPAYSDNPADRLERAEPVLLFPGRAARFSYLGEEADGSRRWTDRWDAGRALRLPLAVHVLLEPESGEGEPLELLARIRGHEHRSIRPNVAGTGGP